MASENWDDHDRTGRTIGLDVGKNYLTSCDSNAIIFTNGITIFYHYGLLKK